MRKVYHMRTESEAYRESVVYTEIHDGKRVSFSVWKFSADNDAEKLYEGSEATEAEKIFTHYQQKHATE